MVGPQSLFNYVNRFERCPKDLRNRGTGEDSPPNWEAGTSCPPSSGPSPGFLRNGHMAPRKCPETAPQVPTKCPPSAQQLPTKLPTACRNPGGAGGEGEIVGNRTRGRGEEGFRRWVSMEIFFRSRCTEAKKKTVGRG